MWTNIVYRYKGQIYQIAQTSKKFLTINKTSSNGDQIKRHIWDPSSPNQVVKVTIDDPAWI